MGIVQWELEKMGILTVFPHTATIVVLAHYSTMTDNKLRNSSTFVSSFSSILLTSMPL